MTFTKALLASTVAASALATTALPALADDPLRANMREGKADFADKELSVLYGFGPGAIDFAVTSFLSAGLSADDVFKPQNWYYRATWKIVDNSAAGLAIALNGGVLNTRERLAGDTYEPPTWGWQGGFLVSLATDSGLIFRAGLQLYDTDWTTSTGQQFLFTPEIAYRLGIVEVSVVPSWPLSLANLTWVGVRLRI